MSSGSFFESARLTFLKLCQVFFNRLGLDEEITVFSAFLFVGLSVHAFDFDSEDRRRFLSGQQSAAVALGLPGSARVAVRGVADGVDNIARSLRR